MKKCFCFLLALIELFVLGSCAGGKTPLEQRISVSDFSQYADITIGEKSYDCIIEYLDGIVSVTAQSSAASGLRQTYDGSELTLNYENMEVPFSGSSADVVNPAVEIFNVISYINNESVTAIPFENGVRVDGNIQLGAFTAVFNKDYSLNYIDIKNANIYIKFKAPS